MTRYLLAAAMAVLPMNLGCADDDAKALLEKARTALQDGKFKEAAEFAEKAAKADEKNADAPATAGAAYLRLRDNESAIKAFTTALDRNPKLASARDRRGDAYLKSGKWKEA